MSEQSPATTTAHEQASEGQSSQSSHGENVRQSSDAARQASRRVARSAADFSQEYGQHYVSEPAQDLVGIMKDYAREKPDVAAMWCFGLGVLVGWKLKP